MIKDIFLKKGFFKFFCDKNKSFFDKLNDIEVKKNILSSSYTSLDRYSILHYYLIDKDYFKSDIKILDLGCYIWLYIHFLNYIWIKEIYWLDYSEKSIIFWKKLWIRNLYFWDIKDILSIFSIKFDVISCLHVFEYSFIKKNGKEFIYDTLSKSFALLKDWWIIFFSIWDWYQKWDKVLNKYIHIDWKVDINIQKILDIWFINYEKIWRAYYVFKK